MCIEEALEGSKQFKHRSATQKRCNLRDSAAAKCTSNNRIGKVHRFCFACTSPYFFAIRLHPYRNSRKIISSDQQSCAKFNSFLFYRIQAFHFFHIPQGNIRKHRPFFHPRRFAVNKFLRRFISLCKLHIHTVIAHSDNDITISKTIYRITIKQGITQVLNGSFKVKHNGSIYSTSPKPVSNTAHPAFTNRAAVSTLRICRTFKIFFKGGEIGQA